MLRLFVALRPAAPQRAALIAAMGGVPGARWQDDAQLHLTLAFLGDVAEPAAADVALALAGVRRPAIPLTLTGVGSFASRDRVHSLWAGAEPVVALADLAAAVRTACQRVGVTVERRTFVPHVTLARLNAPAAACTGFLARQALLRTEPALIGQFGLYESRLSATGSRYTLLRRYPLGAM